MPYIDFTGTNSKKPAAPTTSTGDSDSNLELYMHMHYAMNSIIAI